MPGRANRAQNDSRRAIEGIIAKADHCPADCWLQHEGNIERSLTGWPLKTRCGICGLEVKRQEWSTLSRRLSEPEPA